MSVDNCVFRERFTGGKPDFKRQADIKCRKGGTGMKKREKYRKVRRLSAICHAAPAAFLAAGLLLAAALAEPAEAAEPGRQKSAGQTEAAARSGAAEQQVSALQPGSAIKIEKSLGYGYSASEAEIRIALANDTETKITMKNISCDLTDEGGYFSVNTSFTGTDVQNLEIDPDDVAELCLVKFQTGRPVQKEPYTASLQIKYTDDAGAEQSLLYELSVTVGRKSIEDCRIEGIEKKYYYTGKEIRPDMVITNGSQTLTDGRDYTVEYASNTEVGTGRVTITGNGNYRGKTEKSFEIAWYDGPVIPRFNGEDLSETWYAEDVRITAEGCTISDSLTGTFADSYLVSEEGEHSLSLYYKTQEGCLTNAENYSVRIDKNAPVITEMQISGITNHDASVNVKAADTGSGISRYYLYCTPEEQETITAEMIKASSDTMRMDASEAASGAAVFSLQELSEGTAYYLYAAVEDISGKLSEVQTGSFTAKKTVPAEALAFHVSASADAVSVEALTDTEEYGKAVYRLLDASGQTVLKDWQEDPIFAGLTENTAYTVNAKYTGSDAYMESETAGRQVTTKRWASVAAPENLAAQYGQVLKDIALPRGWSWADSSLPVTVANSGYEARFQADTEQYDYSRIEGYDPENGYIARLLPVKVAPAEPVLTWKPGDTQAVVYTGKAASVAAPEVALLNNEVFRGSVSWSWKKDSDSSGGFTAGLPSEPGTYVVRASVEADGNYSAASADRKLTIDWLKNAPDAGLSDQNGKGLSAGVWCSEAVLSAPEGYEISLSPAEKYGSTVRSTADTGKNGGTVTYYLRQKAGGGIARKTVTVYVDRTAPTGSIAVSGIVWNRTLPGEDSELRIPDKKDITISAEDGQSGVKTVEYTISGNKCKSREEIQKLDGWQIYNPDAKPDIRQNGTNYVYVRITDQMGNRTWLSTGKIVYEPVSKNGGSSGGSGSSGSQSGQTPSSGTGSKNSVKNSGTKGSAAPEAPEKGTPYIHGRESINGWTAIKEELEDARPGETVILDMNGAAAVPGNVLSVMKGRDVRLVLNMEENIVWTIEGQSFTAEEIQDIDFTVDMETQAIPEELVQKLAGERSTVQISLGYDGELGFTAVLTIRLDETYAGLYANLFSYQDENGELEHLDSRETGADGEVEFSFTHASDYLIVMDEEPFDGTEQAAEEEDLTLPEKDLDEEKSGIRTPVLILVICLIVLAGGSGLCIWLIRKNRKEDTGEDLE